MRTRFFKVASPSRLLASSLPGNPYELFLTEGEADKLHTDGKLTLLIKRKNRWRLLNGRVRLHWVEPINGQPYPISFHFWPNNSAKAVELLT
jgi:hypothetical protein